MIECTSVSLEPASVADATLLSNLLELYVHDMSEVFPSVQLSEEGRFGYPKLPLYWSDPERRFAFVIKCGARVAGFALATRGSPAAEDAETLDVAEFFVLRQFRRSGVGQEAALLLWNRLPGAWTVRVSQGNPAALEFWDRATALVPGGTRTEFELPGTPHPWRVFAFVSAPSQ